MVERVLPQDPDMERAVLGGLLIDPAHIDAVSDTLTADDFADIRHAVIYEAILGLRTDGEVIDPVTVHARLGSRSEEVGGWDYLLNTLNHTPTSLHTEGYARTVRRLAIQRRLILAAGTIAGLAYADVTDVGDLVAEAERLISETSNEVRPSVAHLDDLMDTVFKNIEHPLDMAGDRVFTGYPGIDGSLLGIENGRLWVHAAVPGTGKTVMSLNIARGVLGAQTEAVVLYFHPEQPASEIAALLMATGTGEEDGAMLHPIRIKAMQMSKARREAFIKAASFIGAGGRNATRDEKREYLVKDITKEERLALRNSLEPIKGNRFLLSDPSGKNIYQISAIIRRVRAQLPPDIFLLVIFDGAHLIPGAGEGNRYQELTTITRELKIAAQRYVQPGAVLANTQLNRQIYGRSQGNSADEGRKYNLSDLRDSGSWEQDSDVIGFIDRDWVWADQTTAQAPPRLDNGRIYYQKNRQTSQLYRMPFSMHTSTMRIYPRNELN